MLVDEAFLRRLPDTIEMPNPTDGDFFGLLQTCQSPGIVYHQDAAEDLLRRHFPAAKGPWRFCHPRDLIQLVDNRCRFLGTPRELTVVALDTAVGTYFTTS